MTGAIPLLTLYAFVAWTRRTSPCVDEKEVLFTNNKRYSHVQASARANSDRQKKSWSNKQTMDRPTPVRTEKVCSDLCVLPAADAAVVVVVVVVVVVDDDDNGDDVSSMNQGL